MDKAAKGKTKSTTVTENDFLNSRLCAPRTHSGQKPFLTTLIAMQDWHMIQVTCPRTPPSSCGRVCPVIWPNSSPHPVA